MVSHLALATASIGDVALAQQYVNVARTLTGESYTLLVCSFSELIAKAQAGLDREEAVAALTLLLESVRSTGMPDALVISYRAYPRLLELVERQDLRTFVRNVVTLAHDELLGTRFGVLRTSDLDPLACTPYLLTDRELEVAQAMCDGLTNRQIGERLFITESTVKRHVHSLLGKLRVDTRLQAVLLARKLWYGETGT